LSLAGLPRPARAAVVGASGGIGGALVRALEAAGFDHVHALARSGPERVDIEDEASIAAAAERLGEGAPLRLVIVATGLLHANGLAPEKALRELDPAALARSFRVNAIGPALVAKHLVPLMPRDGRAVFAALSARVGSIADNRLGGWYGYRASKAALNQFVRTLAVEAARQRPELVCLALHPGTVDSGLSKPFQRGVPAEKLFRPEDAAAKLLAVIDAATPADSGMLLAHDGARIPF
jgi:NAD(P)-dependent dehydrogenase (short-subunit alcohol dehydrogenase family)